MNAFFRRTDGYRLTVPRKSRVLSILLGCSALAVLSPNAPAESYATAVPAAASLSPSLVANHCYTAIDSSLAEVDVMSMLHIASERDVAHVRATLVHQFWPDGLPLDAIPVIAIDEPAKGADETHSGLFKYLLEDQSANLRAEYKLTVELGFGFRSIIYLWVPNLANHRLFIVHDGHADDSIDQSGNILVRAVVNSTNFATVKTLLQRGYAVMWIQMPLYGDNLTASLPMPPFSSGCDLHCDRHAEIFRAFNGSAVSPYKFFLEPVVAAINYATAKGAFTHISMMGSSGGGWVTLLAAAIDPRINLSASVAGSLPLYLRSGTCGVANRGDAEQESQPGVLFNRISYLDLYVLAANGARRQHLQINNQFDSCCFFGISYLSYEVYLSNFITTRGLGNYRYYLDSMNLGHGYNVSRGRLVRNNTLSDVVLPAASIEVRR